MDHRPNVGFRNLQEDQGAYLSAGGGRVAQCRSIGGDAAGLRRQCWSLRRCMPEIRRRGGDRSSLVLSVVRAREVGIAAGLRDWRISW